MEDRLVHIVLETLMKWFKIAKEEKHYALAVAFLIYLFLALRTHRLDRKDLENFN